MLFRSEWFGTGIQNLRPKTVQQIAWEVHHIGFRLELRHLDRTLVRMPLSVDRETWRAAEERRDKLLQEVFAGRPLTSDTLSAANTGLEAEDIRDRAASLDALRRLVLRWPEVPNAVRDCPALTSATPGAALLQAERDLTQYYCQMFWEHGGRAPIVPRRLPL